jgi:hypothetical protein
VKDVPINGIITIDELDANGNIVEYETAISNLPNAFETDEKLANKNGYHRYTEDAEPEYDAETEYLSSEYAFDGEQITKVWIINEIPVDEVTE